MPGLAGSPLVLGTCASTIVADDALAIVAPFAPSMAALTVALPAAAAENHPGCPSEAEHALPPALVTEPQLMVAVSPDAPCATSSFPAAPPWKRAQTPA